jgi:hypothetical protein
MATTRKATVRTTPSGQHVVTPKQRRQRQPQRKPPRGHTTTTNRTTSLRRRSVQRPPTKMTIRREIVWLLVGLTLLALLLGAETMFKQLVLALMMVISFFFASK